jgi:hypothetical protein
MMARGVVLAAQALGARLSAAGLSAARLARYGAAAALVVAGIAVALGRDHDAHTYADATRVVGMVTPADLRVMRQMATALPPGTPVFANGIDDAGQWSTALTPDPIYLTKDWLIAHPHDTRVAAVADACTDPQSARRALEGAGAVFVGARERAAAKHHWDAGCIDGIPGVRLIAEERDGAGHVSAAFEVTGGSG